MSSQVEFSYADCFFIGLVGYANCQVYVGDWWVGGVETSFKNTWLMLFVVMQLPKWSIDVVNLDQDSLINVH